jgi:alkanesulfonate monooxygenase SsuD/methylene tetrahydromethanopterin reductase-like flavin-dependent oxidoreductase (luciferase family)
MQLLSDGRFTLGLGAGENLNEHIVGGRWPIAGVRHQMLEEAVEIIRVLWAGGTVTYRGKHFDVESAKVWDLPDTAPRSASRCRGREAVVWRDGTPTP